MGNANVQKAIRLRLLLLRRNVLRWLKRRSTKPAYSVVVSLVIGLIAGLVAVGLKYLVGAVRDRVYGYDPTREQLLSVFFPILGILLTVAFIGLVLRRPLEAGLRGLIHRISNKKVNLPRYETYGHVIASSLTVGFGGSVGLEAPIIRTGSAIGANLGGFLRAGRREQTLFLACGAAGGMAAIFNSPVAGVVFAFEVLLTDIALHSFIPLLIAAATGGVVARLLNFEQLLFLPGSDWTMQSLPFYVVLGVLCGFFSVYMIRITLFIGKKFERRPSTPWLRTGMAALGLGGLIFLFPPLFGEGYTTVNSLFAGDPRALLDHSPFYGLGDSEVFFIGFALLLVFSKALASALTLALGGNGGVFAPAMFTGATMGFLFAFCVNEMEWIELNTANFTAVAMAGLLSGVFKSPLTGIFLIAEITGGYALFVPLMLVAALAFFVTSYFEPYSVFTRELYEEGLWVPPYQRDRTILKNMDIRALVETNFLPIRPEMTLGAFVEVIARSHRNIFPVLDPEQKIVGIVLLDDVREMMFHTEKYEEVRMEQVMHNPPAILDVRESMESVMEKFDHHNAWNLPVAENGRYLGFLSKSSVFNQYRQQLIERNDEGV